MVEPITQPQQRRPRRGPQKHRTTREAAKLVRLLEPYSADPKTPIEMLCALAGRAAFLPEIDERGGDHALLARYPYNSAHRLGLPRLYGVKPASAVAGTRSDWSMNPEITSQSDIAAALGMHNDRLGADLAKAIACSEILSNARFTAMLDGLRPRVLAGLSPETWRRLGRKGNGSAHDSRREANRYRVRIVLYDVLTELLSARPRQEPLSTIAKASKMRAQDYKRLHREITGMLLHVANNAARTAVDALRR